MPINIITFLIILTFVIVVLIKQYFKHRSNNEETFRILNRDIAAKRNEEEQLKQTISEKQNELVNLGKQLDAMNVSFENLKAFYDKKTEDYKAEMEEKYDKIEDEQLSYIFTLRDEVEELTAQLKDLRSKQDAYNNTIQENKKKEEQLRFYCLDLDEDDIRDIDILLSAKEKLTKTKNLDKIIYDNYISKKVSEMNKRVLNNCKPSGIYKITRLKTGEVYIGKSTDVYRRWSEHCKSVYGVSSISGSLLHNTMRKDGIQNFSFELLEEVPKEQLTEREKYWIEFYNSTVYGLNERK